MVMPNCIDPLSQIMAANYYVDLRWGSLA
jgi:hypothetical protein